MRPGEKILVSTGGEKEYHCAVSDFPEGEVLAAVEGSHSSRQRTPVRNCTVSGSAKR